MVEKTELDYCCYWCLHPFKQLVGKAGGGKDAQGRQISVVSDQVKCPRCGNFLKTWS